jgi:hypothetical protein
MTFFHLVIGVMLSIGFGKTRSMHAGLKCEFLAARHCVGAFAHVLRQAQDDSPICCNAKLIKLLVSP